MSSPLLDILGRCAGSIMKIKFASILPVLALMAACHERKDNAAQSAVPASTPVSAAIAASQSDAILSGADKATYTRELNLSLNNVTEADWKTYYQTTLDAISNSSTTTTDQLAAVKYPGYGSIRNPFDKQQFQDAHKRDLSLTSTTPAKIKLIFDGRGYYPVSLSAGNPLKGHYAWQGSFQQMMVGYSWQDVTRTVDAKGVVHEKRVNTIVRYHLNSFAPRINRKYEKDVSLDLAKQIESELNRDGNGNQELPAIVYTTIQSVQVTGSDDQSTHAIDVNLAVDGFDVAVGKGKEIKPLFD
ncbi:hypothetical protein KDX23_02885 [Burkholderia vietnamiensis]|nr:hypothetical protein [Burkholderia vietnamiensis]